MSPQEEETLALAAIARLGEASAHDVATELGVMTIRNTLGRLVDSGRLVKRRLRRERGDVWVFTLPAKKRYSACRSCGTVNLPSEAPLCNACFFDANIGRAALAS